jgi:methylated-DNA-[protein]-cysteine S-methyltransferase
VKQQLQASDVYDILCKIPEGKVTTYGDIAKVLGSPRASRAIGRILKRNPNPIVVPCHRVVMSSGQIGGYAFGKAIKRKLLMKEGISFSSHGIVENFAGLRINLEKSANGPYPPLQARADEQEISPGLR